MGLGSDLNKILTHKEIERVIDPKKIEKDFLGMRIDADDISTDIYGYIPIDDISLCETNYSFLKNNILNAIRIGYRFFIIESLLRIAGYDTNKYKHYMYEIDSYSSKNVVLTLTKDYKSRKNIKKRVEVDLKGVDENEFTFIDYKWSFVFKRLRTVCLDIPKYPKELFGKSSKDGFVYNLLIDDMEKIKLLKTCIVDKTYNEDLLKIRSLKKNEFLYMSW